MNIAVTHDPRDSAYRLSGHISSLESDAIGREIVTRAIAIAAERLADQFIADRGQAILAALDPVAVANLAVADSGRAIREALEKSIPREVQHHYHNEREVYKVGLFGDVRWVR